MSIDEGKELSMEETNGATMRRGRKKKEREILRKTSYYMRKAIEEEEEEKGRAYDWEKGGRFSLTEQRRAAMSRGDDSFYSNGEERDRVS